MGRQTHNCPGVPRLYLRIMEKKEAAVQWDAPPKAGASITIVIPAMDEELTISKTVEWCIQGIRDLGLKGQVLVVDSSSDRTAERALASGADVISVPPEGIGKAYRRAKDFITGEFVIMGDADCTYDFRDLHDLVGKIVSGFDLCLGNRFLGTIQEKAMPRSHRYLGNPMTSWLFSVVLGLKLGDIHCGIRSLTKKLYLQLTFREAGWEYASDMIVEAQQLGARVAEVGVDFYRTAPGRQSHLIRQGPLAAMKAGFGTLRIIFRSRLGAWASRVGAVLFGSGGLLVLVLAAGPVRAGPFVAGILAQMTFVTTALFGLVVHTMGNLFDRAQNLQKPKATKTLASPAVPWVLWALMLTSFFYSLAVTLIWVRQDFRLLAEQSHLAHGLVAALFLSLSSMLIWLRRLILDDVRQSH